MNDAANAMDLNALAMLPSAEYERLARLRERQKRERKEALYSPGARKHKANQ